MKKLCLCMILFSLSMYGGLSKEFYYEIFDYSVNWYDFSASPYDNVTAKAWIPSRPSELLTTENGKIAYIDIAGISILYFNIGEFETDWTTGEYIEVIVQDHNNISEGWNSDFKLDSDVLDPLFDGPSFGTGQGIIVSVFNHWDSINDEIIPETVTLYQNYPNPFNPATNIKFSLRKTGNIELSVYNISGQLVRKVLDKEMAAGYHSIKFVADDLNSGMYFYKLKACGKELTKKMLRVK